MFKIIKKIISWFWSKVKTTIGLIAALLGIITFIIAFNIHKNPKEFIKNPYKYLFKKEVQTSDTGRSSFTPPHKPIYPPTKHNSEANCGFGSFLVLLILITVVYYVLWKNFKRPGRSQPMLRGKKTKDSGEEWK